MKRSGKARGTVPLRHAEDEVTLNECIPSLVDEDEVTLNECVP
jgi:hypothetical protein